MRILLTNDDGFGAPGLEALRKFLSTNYGDSFDVWTVAPDSEKSSTGHSLTLQNILKLKKLNNRDFTCNGFPADCVHLSLKTILKECKPDIVISGINRGSNLGQDIYYSGTCAAAREASFFDIPSIALSLDSNVGDESHFENIFPILSYIIDQKIYLDIPLKCSLNINAPNTKELPRQWKFCEIGFAAYNTNLLERKDSKGRDYYWLGSGPRVLETDDSNSDIYWVKNKVVSVSACRWIPSLENDFSKVEGKLIQ